MRKYFYLGIILLGHIFAFSSNDPAYFKHLSIKDGLSNGWIRCIYQDDNDFIWIGTSDGLNRYDGTSFNTYRPYLPGGFEQGNITVNAILKKDAETLWVCTDIGMYTYNYLTDSYSYYPITSEPIPFLSCAYDQQKNLWIGTSQGVIKVNPNQEIEQVYTHNPNDPGSVSSDYINNIFVDSKNNLWLGTKHGLNLFESKTNTFLRFQAEDKVGDISGNDVLAITEDRLGRKWIGTALHGINMVSEINGKYSFKQILDGAIISLLIDSENYLWAGHGSEGGLTRIDLNNFSIENLKISRFEYNPMDPKTISENSIFCFLEDRNKDIWIGTFSKGVNYFSRRAKKFQIVQEMYRSDLSIRNNLVNAIFEEDNFLWIGTEGGLDRMDKKTGKYKHYNNNPNDPFSLASNSIFKIFKDSRQNLWIGTWGGGLHRYDYQHDRFVRFLSDGKPGSLSNNNVFSIAEDHDRKLWVTTDGGGLNLFDYGKKTFTVFRNQVGDTCSISSNFLDYVSVVSSGELIISLYSSINKFNSETGCFEVFNFNKNKKEEVFNGNIILIFEDSQKNIWIATDIGLVCYDVKTRESTSYSSIEGLPNNTIQSIEEDNHGNLWLGTSNGLSMFRQAVFFPHKPEFINFSTLDGLSSNDFKKRSSFKNKQGYLYFGTSNGYTRFHPDSIFFNSTAPKVVFTKMALHSPKSPEKNNLKSIIHNINNLDEIELKYGYADFTLNFASLNYLYPEANSYKFKLDGYDNDWIISKNKNEVTYTNIKQGEYIFIVYGSNNDGVWSEKPRQLKIVITPPWWNTMLFKSFVFLIAVLIIGFIIRLRFAILKRRNKQLQTKVDVRTSELISLNRTLQGQKDEIAEKNSVLFMHQNQLEELVKERTKEMEKAKEKAEENDRLKSSFLANMSHEIRTPLNSIIGFSELLSNPDFESDQRYEFASLINSSGSNLLVIISDIMDISKIEAGQVEVRKSVFPAQKIIHDIYKEYKFRAIDKGIILNIDTAVPIEDYLIESDETKLKQVLINFVGNALKFTEKGTVEIGMKVDGIAVEYYVKDTGIGIPAEYHERIFERFRQVEGSSTRRYGGNGLGLAISKSLIEMLGGTIGMESVPGEGSVFYFTLPDVVK